MGVSIDTGGKGGKKALDAELNLVPFIDLLVCCICFLLITAVWTQMARIEVNQKSKGSAAEKKEDTKMQVKITVLIGDDGYTITAGPERIVIAKEGELYNTEELSKKLGEIKIRLPDKDDLVVAVEDGVLYKNIIAAMDIALKQKFPNIKLSDSTTRL
ncbi:MAG: biopolymer transporter ExbD [Pseudomonadota bacterium]